jgi:hypothetical protein
MERPLSKRCSICNINWKAHRKTCPKCGDADLWDSYTVEHDEDRIDEDEKQEFLPIVVEYQGLLWIPHDGLIASGQDCLESFKLVTDDEDDVYELQGHVQDKTGETGGMWWVERVVIDVPVTTDGP